MKSTRAIFPGTFDPFTIGHHSLVERALGFTGEIIIAIGCNSDKKNYFPVEKRMEFIKHLYRNEPRVKVRSYDTLTTDFAEEVEAGFILRGIRTVNDFEYEKKMADVNRKLTGIDTIILFTEPEYTYVSSDVVRELLRYGKDISIFVPNEINYSNNGK
ncbi:MAG: pantetheine-phosphate adenylyltransferase [Tannerella sp.]|jgi:pantetheine-phosphate adenylyltransferase|nr:pantetheine-phosphate adenylyltransferase [Tannerella sp.]